MLPKNLNGVRFTPVSGYNRLVTILKPGTGSDDEGTPVAPEVFASNVPARVRSVPSTGRPDMQQQITQAVAYFIVIIRYRPGITDDMTILGPGGEVWVVTSIDNPDFANVELRLTVREINGGQG